MGEYGVNLDLTQLVAGATSGIAIWELLRKGFGLFPMSDHIARDFTDVTPVLPGVLDMDFPVWLVTHRALQTSRRIRLVFDLLAEMLLAP